MVTLADRKVACILAACCADAAAQPLHWIYNQSKLDALTAGREEIEFRVPSANPFYRIDTGKNTCYGDQAFALLESLVASKGLDVNDQVERYYRCFGPESVYENNRNAAYASHDLEEKYRWDGPIQAPWRNGSIKDFLKNVEDKKEATGSPRDQQIDGVTKVAPIVAMYAGQADCMDKVEEVIRLTQDNDFTVAVTVVAARILEKALLYGKEKSLREVTEEVLAALSDSTNPDRGELDAHMAGLLRQVLQAGAHSHMKAVQTTFAKN